MKTENQFVDSGKLFVFGSEVSNMFQEYLHEKVDGLSLFEKVMLTLYSSMTVFFFGAAVYFVLTKGLTF